MTYPDASSSSPSPSLHLAAALALAWSSSLLGTAATAASPAEIRMSQVLAIESVTRPGRSAVRIDPVEASLVAGGWRAPREGEVVTGASGRSQPWETVTANAQGALPGAAGRAGYIYWPVPSDRRQVMILEAAGDGCVYVNGEIRVGDSYGHGYLRVPVLLREGTNDFLFQRGRGELRAKLTAPSEPLSLHPADSTLPDVIVGDPEPLWGAVVLVNATPDFMQASLRVKARGSPMSAVQLPPLGICKVPFQVRPPRLQPLTNAWPITLEAISRSARKPAPTQTRVNLRVRQPHESHVRTFRSEIDGSVQYYAVTPPLPQPTTGAPPALFLSLHGAGVEARGQAESYSPKAWGVIVCPTNRRPFGFDWEEWGRWDALEVLALATARYQPDPRRIYLTGHSMGGHGTWQLGALFPDRFAAIGPSAGWISFRSYANPGAATATNAVQHMLARAAAASDTLLMATNYLPQGVYVLHGDADDNVPVTEAREMRRVLSGFHRDVDFHEQPGAGHWWDATDEPGTDCVDWMPMFDFFARRAIPTPDSLRRVRYVTVNPAVSSRSHWVSVLAQERSLEPSAVEVRCDPGKRRVVGVTTNVSRLGLDFPSLPPGPGLTIELDGQKLGDLVVPNRNRPLVTGSEGSPPRPELCLVREAGQWRVGEYPSPALKRPERSGPFREAFRRRVALVYATRGTPEENAWSLAKARYDSETFYYRGNGSMELVADVDIVAHEARRKTGKVRPEASRNLILYGHADCNAAWAVLLGQSPVQIQRGRARLGDRQWTGDDVGALFLQPHPRDERALVGVVGGSGLRGLRVTERMPYFVSGAGFPDCLILGAELPAQGLPGIRAAGFFGPDWQVTSGEFAWAE